VTVETLIAEYTIEGLDRCLYSDKATWGGAEFEQDADLSGRLILRKEVTSNADAESATAELDEAANQLALALSWRIRRTVTARRIRLQRPSFDGNGEASAHSSLVATDQVEGSYGPPKPPPDVMPQIPAEGERLIKTVCEASAFGAFVEEQLRRHQLIIEELADEFESDLPGQSALLDEIKLVRDFVSHPVCDRPKVVTFIRDHLPSALLPCGTKVSFHRDDEHRAFVARYEVKARVLAAKLISLTLGL
jgi:hypothetical protein